jgi:ribosomal-protein-alanine N-acetyltransferase
MADSRVLRTARLELQPFQTDHLTTRYVSWMNDKATLRYSEQRHRAHTLDTCRSYAGSFVHSPSFFWAIIALDPPLGHVGNMTATVDPNNRIADLAILIGDAKARGRGLGLDAWKCACHYLIAEARMRKVTAGTMSVNTPMLRIMSASAMIEEGRRRGDFLFEGKPVDRVMAALFAEQIGY